MAGSEPEGSGWTKHRLTTRAGASSRPRVGHGFPWALVAGVVAAVATVVAAIGGLYFNAQSVRQATEQARLTEQAQASERFSRSVEQLGSASEPVRMGAIHALGALMRDSPRDQPGIVAILSSYIRLRAEDGRLGRGPVNSPPIDVLAAVSVLDAQPTPRELSGTDGVVTTWPSMELSDITLQGVSFEDASLREADLQYARFTGVDFLDADLTGSNLSNTQWWRTSLTAATLDDTNLEFAMLYKQDLISASLRNANLHCANLTEAWLGGASLRGADLREADLTDAKLVDADLSGADLTGAVLRGADLTGADVSGSDLSGVDLRESTLTGVTDSSDTTWPSSRGPRPNCG